MTESYDVLIIGAGAAGYTASIYAARYNLKVLIIGSDPGGVANTAYDIQNWPGFKGSGIDLMNKFREHVTSFGIKIIIDNVYRVEKSKDGFAVRTEKQEFKCKSLIIATGSARRKLGVSGEDELFGRGVSYCVTCDGIFFKNRIVGVIGGSDSAAMAAQMLANIAKKVYVIYRKDKLRAEPARIEDLKKKENVKFIYNTNVTKIIGDKKLQKIELDKEHDGKTELNLDGLFIEIGGIPTNAMAKELGVELDESGRVKVDDAMQTNVQGIYAAGDITTGSNRFNQIITAGAEGAIAAVSAFKFVTKSKS